MSFIIQRDFYSHTSARRNPSMPPSPDSWSSVRGEPFPGAALAVLFGALQLWAHKGDSCLQTVPPAYFSLALWEGAGNTHTKRKKKREGMSRRLEKDKGGRAWKRGHCQGFLFSFALNEEQLCLADTSSSAEKASADEAASVWTHSDGQYFSTTHPRFILLLHTHERTLKTETVSRALFSGGTQTFATGIILIMHLTKMVRYNILMHAQ